MTTMCRKVSPFVNFYTLCSLLISQQLCVMGRLPFFSRRTSALSTTPSYPCVTLCTLSQPCTSHAICVASMRRLVLTREKIMVILVHNAIISIFSEITLVYRSFTAAIIYIVYVYIFQDPITIF